MTLSGAYDGPCADDGPVARWREVTVVGPCRGTTACLAFGASTETAGSEEVGVGCDIAVLLHSKTVDKVTTTDGTAKPDENLMRCLPKRGRNSRPDSHELYHGTPIPTNSEGA